MKLAPPPCVSTCTLAPYPQLAHSLGHGDEDIKKFVRPGLTGRTLKDHIKVAMRDILPSMTELECFNVDLSALVPAFGVVKMYLRKFGALLTSVMTDPSIVGDASQHVDLRQALPGALSGSKFMRGLQGSVPRGHDMLAGGVYYDGALVDAAMKHSLIPVSVFIHQLSAGVAMSKSGSSLLG